MVQIARKEAIQQSLPDGFDTTLQDEDHIRKLNSQSTNNLTETVVDYGNKKLTERDVIQSVINRVEAAYTTTEGTLELPGLGIEQEAGHIMKFAAAYKADADTPTGTVKSIRRASADDLVFCFATPEVYEEISGTNQHDFKSSGLTADNTFEVVGDNGGPAGGSTNGNVLSMDSDEMMFFTGDFIDISAGPSPLTKFEYPSLDGDDFGHQQALLETRLSGAHLPVAPGAWIRTEVDIDAKIYEDGDVELVPVAFYMGPGSKAPVLV